MSIEDIMADLKIEYLADLPRKIEVIQSDLDNDLKAKVRDGFHKLKGTGKTYGLPEISELCEILEELCVSSEERIPEFTPLGLSLLDHIQKMRTNQQVPDLNSFSEFQSLKEFQK